ncbi:dynein light chain Tctex-type 3-like [Choloepus didactylus]|uniref:dynein light chain Tctex-type 3-like n=1 Tax=Choloepus didactylus TaxID=27675 RepID=UPI00189FAB52|nr:dynein light chain Tctex-type 3-like [Choloepus didactylus]
MIWQSLRYRTEKPSEKYTEQEIKGEAWKNGLTRMCPETSPHHSMRYNVAFLPSVTGLSSTIEEYHRHCDESFNADEAHNIVKRCVDEFSDGEDYNQNNINQWTARIVEHSLTHFVKLGKVYKNIVTFAVVQRSACGLHTASSCFWDAISDGNCIVRWENQATNCIVNVFAIAVVL